MLYLGADHRGFKLKEKVRAFLEGEGYQFKDLGNLVHNLGDDYPDFAAEVAFKVSENPERNQGILFCGSGVGMDIAANKFKGVRSALVWGDDEALVKQSRQHDDSNILTLPADHLTEEQTKRIVKLWLETPFLKEERHVRRIQKIKSFE